MMMVLYFATTASVSPLLLWDESKEQFFNFVEMKLLSCLMVVSVLLTNKTNIFFILVCRVNSHTHTAGRGNLCQSAPLPFNVGFLIYIFLSPEKWKIPIQIHDKIFVLCIVKFGGIFFYMEKIFLNYSVYTD
jgi:hypothetical protein